MSLNKSKGHMYKFITHTWNALGGDCWHGCTYCSTNKFFYQVQKDKYSGPVRLYDNYLNDNLGKNRFIFVCSQHDLFAANIPDEWILKILQHCNKFDNRYLFQTKNPANICRILPPKSIVCVTLESNIYYSEIMGNSPKPYERYKQMKLIKHPLFITIEPVLDFDMYEFVMMVQELEPVQVNIGADSGGNNLPEPNVNKLMYLIHQLRKSTRVVIKDNLKRLMT